MFIWAAVNSLLALLALLCIAVNRNSPHRLRFWIALVALLAWLVPWSQMSWNAPTAFTAASLQQAQDVVARYSYQLELSEPTGIPALGTAATNSLRDHLISHPFGSLPFAAACLIGLALFAADFWKHRRYIRKLENTGELANHLRERVSFEVSFRIMIQQEVQGAFTSGLRRPTIWLHRNVLSSSHLDAVLLHEATHIAQHDNLYLTLITFMERLFWWNPLVLLLAKQSRDLLELSCDESCAKSLPDYRSSLARLMLDQQMPEKAVDRRMYANIVGKKRAGIRRVELLERKFSMKASHYMATAVTAIGALCLVAVVTAQTEEGTAPENSFFTTTITRSDAAGAQGAIFIGHQGDLVVSRVPLADVIARANGVRSFQVVDGPDWIHAPDVYDMKLVPSPTYSAAGNIEQMLRMVLSERFVMEVQPTTREMPVLALETLPSEPGFEFVSTETRDALIVHGSAAAGSWNFRMDFTFDAFAEKLSRELGEDVINSTGLSGTYRMELENIRADGPFLEYAPLLERVGVRLIPRATDVEVLVISSITRPEVDD